MHRGGGIILRAAEQRGQHQQPFVRAGALRRGGCRRQAPKIVGAILILGAVIAGVCLHGRSESAPLRRDELLHLRQYSERIRREEVLPFE